jgi:hypothetical protein
MYAACGPESDPCGIFSFKILYLKFHQNCA